MPVLCSTRVRFLGLATVFLVMLAGVFCLTMWRDMPGDRGDRGAPPVPVSVLSPQVADPVSPSFKNVTVSSSATASRPHRQMPAAPVASGTPVQLIASDPETTILVCTTDGWRLEPETLGDGTLCTAVVPPPGFFPMRRRDWPELPWTGVKLLLPEGGEASLRVVSAEYEEVACAPPSPSRGFFSRSDAAPEGRLGVFYGGGDIFPADPAALGRVQAIGADRCVPVTFYPFSYDPVARLLRICRRLEVEVRVIPAAASRVTARRHRSPDLRRLVCASTVAAVTTTAVGRGGTTAAAAPAGGATATLPVDGGRLLVIVPDAWTAAVAEFAAWKRQRGMTVVVARYPTDTGTGTAALGSYILTRYADPAGLDYVVLVGDAADIPSQTGTSGCPSDTLYSLADTADIYQDMFISRVSAGTATGAQTQLARFIEYEKTPDISGDTGWIRRGVGIASNQNGGTHFAMDKTEMETLRQQWLAAGLTATAVYDPGATTAMTNNAVNAGCGLIFYLGHGTATSWTTGAFDTVAAAALTNAHQLPFVVSGACSTGDFTLTTGDCLAEEWVHAGTAAGPAGAIGFVGATSAMDWDPPVRLEQVVSDYWLNATVHSAGALAFGGVQAAMDFCYAADPSSGGSAARKVMEQTHLFGDCSLEIRTLTPRTVTVQHAAAVPPGQPYTVTVTNQGATRNGIAGATVCLFRADDIQASATTDAAGQAVLTVDGLDGAPLVLTVFKNDIIPYQAEVPLATGPLRMLIGAATTPPTAFTGEPYSFAPIAIGGTLPYSWSCPDLPAWLALDPVTGILGGTPPASGDWSFTLHVADSATAVTATTTLAVTITAGTAVTLETNELPVGTVATVYSGALTAAGSFAPFTFALVSGTLPPGISMNSAGVFSGTPTLAGNWPVTFRVADTKGRFSTKVLNFAVTAAASVTVLTDTLLPPGDVGEDYAQTFHCIGGTGAGFVWSVSGGTLPDGLALSASGTLSGIPTTAGDYSFSVGVADGARPPHTGQKSYTITVNRPVYFESTALPQCVAGLAYAAPVPVAGSYAPFSLSVAATQDFTLETVAHAAYTLAGDRLAAALDETETAVQLPFAFPFCGKNYNSIRIGDNGYIIPGIEDGPPIYCYWKANAVSFTGLKMIAPFWNDLVITADDPATGVFVQQGADRVTVYWRGRGYDNPDWWLSFGTTLYADGRISFFYSDMQTENRTVIGVSGGSPALPKRQLLAYDKSPSVPTWTTSLDWNQHGGFNFVPVQPLPAWLSLDADNVLRGTAPAPGVYQFSILATDAHGFQAVHVFTLTVEPAVHFGITLKPGWNLVGVPLHPYGDAPATVFPGSLSVWTWDAFAQRYHIPQRIDAKTGYWVYLPGRSPLPLTVSGTAVADADASAPLAAGWNMVSPLEVMALPAWIPASPWHWTGFAFCTSTTLQPGTGYWIYAPADRTLNLKTGQ